MKKATIRLLGVLFVLLLASPVLAVDKSTNEAKNSSATYNEPSGNTGTHDWQMLITMTPEERQKYLKNIKETSESRVSEDATASENASNDKQDQDY